MSAVDLQEARVVRVEPGDVIFIQVAKGAWVDGLAEYLKGVWPDNEIIIGQEMDIAIVRPS